MKKNLITALKKLYAAFSGKDEVKNNAVDIVDKIADQVEDGGGGSSSGGAMIINAVQQADPLQFNFDKTWQEIYDHLASGGYAYLKWPNISGYGYFNPNGLYAIILSCKQAYDDQYDIGLNDGTFFYTTSPTDYPSKYFN